ncbi:MAG TPA: amidohydrolase family protein [Longimicrobiales bacterium]|nr:amidohydrolase family protein [Longimicrobiales bacterium]
MRLRILVALALIPPVVMCAGTDASGPRAEPLRREPADLAITDVTVIPMDGERVLQGQTVLIRAGRIASVAPAAEVGPDAGTPTIDGRGHFLLPGLIDMHVHIDAADLDAYVRHGVTSVRNMWGFAQLPAIIAQVDRGERTGPRIFSLTAGFDGSPGVWPQTQLSDDVCTIPANLDRQIENGFTEIKMYQRLSREAYDTLVALARRRGLTFAGHLPAAVPLRHAIDAGQRSIEHLGGFRQSTDLAADAQYAAARGTWVCPTLQIQSLGNRGNGDEQRTAWTRELHRHGVRLLVGTDAGIDVTAPGSSIHDELVQFTRAGISPYDALRGATSLAAEYLRQADSIGRVAPGMEADLLLVRANPLQDIRATRDIAAVIVNGVRIR